MCYTDVPHTGAGEGGAAPPLRTSRCPLPRGAARAGETPEPPCADAMPAKDRRTAFAHARATPGELEQWRAKAKAAGLPLSELLRRAMARTRTWTAAAADAERERSVQIARIGANMNQIARWCNTYKAGAEAAVVLAHLVAIEQELRQLSVRAGETE